MGAFTFRTLGRTIVFMTLLAMLALIAQPARAATLTVNSTGDQSDANAGNGVCQTSVGTCTLRAAIQEANALSGVDTISFSIGSGAQTIYLASMLPDITQPVLILGNTQPGYAGTPLIRVDGNNLVWDGIRLKPGSNGSMIQGLMIVRFNASGIYIDHGDAQSIVGNYIGTDGTTALGNRAGIYVSGGTNTIIGGTSSTTGNLVSGNNYEGIQLVNGTIGALIYGNRIGTNAAGNNAVANNHGIKIDNSDNTSVGGTGSGQGNLISGNTQNGLYLVNGASGSVIQANLIGTDAAGSSAIPNYNGIEIRNSPNNTVGGITTAARNIISGNIYQAIWIFQKNSTGNVVQGNYIGLDATGTMDITTNAHPHGIIVGWAPNTTVGGTEPGAANFISGVWVGLEFYGPSSGGLAQGNYFGTTGAGTGSISLQNQYNIYIYDTADITLGGNAAGAGNFIYGGTKGIWVEGSTNITVQGNMLQYVTHGVELGYDYNTIEISTMLLKSNTIFQTTEEALLIRNAGSLLAGSNDNCFAANQGIGVLNENPSFQNLENNWWDSASGPSGSGYSGSGEVIFGSVDASPWQTTVPSACTAFYNAVQNPSFESGSGSSATNWSGSGRVCYTPPIPPMTLTGYCSYRMGGSGLTEQTVASGGSASEMLQVTARSYASSVPAVVTYRIVLIVNYADGTSTNCASDYTLGSHGYEAKGCTLTTTKAYNSYTVRLQYYSINGTGTVWFDDAHAFRVP